MSKVIVTSRYLKNGLSKNLKNYIKYIATRDGAECVTPSDRDAPATTKQQELISSLLSEFPESKKLLEYEDYTANPICVNASELISTIIERNADLIGNKENLIGYMALRPGAERIGKHGLFSSSNKEIILDQVAKEVAQHKGNVWNHVISLRRDDAERLGYNNANEWKNLVTRHLSTIANAQKIDIDNMKWYAAFHNTTHHPHIHLVVYAENAKQGYLTNEGINSIRSAVTNDIFKHELYSLYQSQTQTRDELKQEAKNLMEKLLEGISQSNFNNENLEHLVKKLYMQLQSANGKKVYGYLTKDVKETVDAILFELAQNDTIKEMYKKWCLLEQEKHSTYSSAKIEFPSLESNSAFKSIKNIIIKEVLSISSIFDVAGISVTDDIETIEASEEPQLYDIFDSQIKQINNISVTKNSNNNNSIISCVGNLFLQLSRIISEDYNQRWSGNRLTVDRKLRRMISEKKQAQGVKDDRTIEQKY